MSLFEEIPLLSIWEGVQLQKNNNNNNNKNNYNNNSNNNNVDISNYNSKEIRCLEI
jgi:hypothetical protein